MYQLDDKHSRAAIAAHPGYVRLVLPTQHAHARAACRKFSQLCQEEDARGGLILTRSSDADPAELESQMALATRGVLPGFKLAIVAQGTDAASIRRIVGATAARRRAKAKAFPSEHRAAAWLIA
jgi:phosphotransferase system HPr-like phosphotransfer protein